MFCRFSDHFRRVFWPTKATRDIPWYQTIIHHPRISINTVPYHRKASSSLEIASKLPRRRRRRRRLAATFTGVFLPESLIYGQIWKSKTFKTSDREDPVQEPPSNLVSLAGIRPKFSAITGDLEFFRRLHHQPEYYTEILSSPHDSHFHTLWIWAIAGGICLPSCRHRDRSRRLSHHLACGPIGSRKD